MMDKKFKKGIGDLREMELTKDEKALMLSRILNSPVKSPFTQPKFSLSSLIHFSPLITACLIVILTSGGLMYASERSLPGEKLYSIKTDVLEPLRETLAVTDIQKLEWEGEKIERRITEAEGLANKGELKEEKLKILGEEIEKSSSSYAQKAEEVSLTTATTSEGKKNREIELKNALKEKLEAKFQVKEETIKSKKGNDDREEDEDENREDRSNKKEKEREKIKQLKERAVKALEREKEEED